MGRDVVGPVTTHRVTHQVDPVAVHVVATLDIVDHLEHVEIAGAFVEVVAAAERGRKQVSALVRPFNQPHGVVECLVWTAGEAVQVDDQRPLPCGCRISLGNVHPVPLQAPGVLVGHVEPRVRCGAQPGWGRRCGHGTPPPV